jgi:hypothetical protein
MLSAGCYFRNDWMNFNDALKLVELMCTVPQLRPDCWNTHEPINQPFTRRAIKKCAEELRAVSGVARTNVLFKWRKQPRGWAGIELLRCREHNDLYLALEKDWPSGELKLSELMSNWVSAASADYAFVADADEVDFNRFQELTKPYSPEEIRLDIRRAPPLISGRGQDGIAWHNFLPIIDEMYGPHGYLWDVVWYNYFGPPYVGLIGKDRLIKAGWARVNEVAGGLECYATERIGDPFQHEKRAAIRKALEEFVWTPDCKREEKRAPVFDFSAQLLHAPETVKNPDPNTGKVIIFAGLTKEQEHEAIQALEEQTGKQFDPVTKQLKPSPKKGTGTESAARDPD